MPYDRFMVKAALPGVWTDDISTKDENYEFHLRSDGTINGGGIRRQRNKSLIVNRQYR